MLEPLFIYGDYHEQATVTATDSKSGTVPVDVLQPDEDNSWSPANVTGSKTLTFDFILQKTIGALAIVGDYLNGVTVEVYGSNLSNFSTQTQLLAPVAMTEYQANFFTWDNDTCRYGRIVFSGFGRSFSVAHVAFCPFAPLPFFDDGIDAHSYQSEGEQIVSPDGYYIGGRKARTMLKTTLAFGQILDSEYALFQAWAEVCVKGFRPFVCVPDRSETRCYFAWTDKSFTFAAPYKNGMREMAKIPITARVV